MPAFMTPVELDTPRFGPIAVDDGDVWTLPGGMIGLPECQRFARLPFDDPTVPFEWLQSLDDPAIAFLLADPAQFFPRYEIALEAAELEDIAREAEVDCQVRCVITVTDPVSDMTANLLGPIVFNPARRLGKQLVLSDTRYATKHRLFPQADAHARP